MGRREAPAILAEFVDGRRGWCTYQEKLDCWSASRRFTLIDRELLFLVTPNWREKESGRDWIGEVIVSSDNNTRIATCRGWSNEIHREMRDLERTIELGVALSTRTVPHGQAFAVLAQVRGAQLNLLRKAFGLRGAGSSANGVRARIVEMAYGSTLKAGL